MMAVLPAMGFQQTPNQSARLAGVQPHLVVLHTWGVPPATTPSGAASRFEGVVSYLSNPRVEVSAHVVYGGTLIPRGRRRCVQQVRWERKAWTQAGCNSFAYSIESADAIWTPAGDASRDGTIDERGLAQLARITAYICTRAGIPPRWTLDPNRAGVTRHRDLGKLGNPSGHTDPTGDRELWQRFMGMVRLEHERGGFRKTWGRGTWPAAV